MSRRQAVPPSNRYNTTFLKASQFVETDEAYKGNAIQDRKIQDRGTQINFRLNLKRDFSFLLQLKFLDGLTAFFLNQVFFLLFLFSFTFFSLFFSTCTMQTFCNLLCTTCFSLHHSCMYKLSVLQFYLSHCKSLFFFLKHSAFQVPCSVFQAVTYIVSWLDLILNTNLQINLSMYLFINFNLNVK